MTHSGKHFSLKNKALITAVKIFKVQAPGVNDINIFRLLCSSQISVSVLTLRHVDKSGSIP
jgi:hypothetical protein